MGRTRGPSDAEKEKRPGTRAGGAVPPDRADAPEPGPGSRPAGGDLPMAELGGGVAAGAILGRLVGGGKKGAAIGAAVGAVAGTAIGLVRGGILGPAPELEALTAREAAFGPGPGADPAGRAPDVGSGRHAGRKGARPGRKAGRPGRKGGRPDRKAGPSGRKADRSGDADLSGWTKAELYEEARKREIPGRSGMTKAELLEALGGGS